MFAWGVNEDGQLGLERVQRPAAVGADNVIVAKVVEACLGECLPCTVGPHGRHSEHSQACRECRLKWGVRAGQCYCRVHLPRQCVPLQAPASAAASSAALPW